MCMRPGPLHKWTKVQPRPTSGELFMAKKLEISIGPSSASGNTGTESVLRLTPPHSACSESVGVPAGSLLAEFVVIWRFRSILSDQTVFCTTLVHLVQFTTSRPT